MSLFRYLMFLLWDTVLIIIRWAMVFYNGEQWHLFTLENGGELSPLFTGHFLSHASVCFMEDSKADPFTAVYGQSQTGHCRALRRLKIFTQLTNYMWQCLNYKFIRVQFLVLSYTRFYQSLLIVMFCVNLFFIITPEIAFLKRDILC